MITIKAYFAISTLAMLSTLLYACYTREQFYTIILFLVTSKMAFLLAANMIIACALLLGNVAKSIFLGRLRDNEVELLVDRCKYGITETLLALTIFRHELSPQIILLFGLLVFMKIFHWLAKFRLDYIQQLMPIPLTTLVRLLSLILVLGASDILVAYLCVKHTLKIGRSVHILFAFECGVLFVSVINYITRYFLHLLDSRLENGLSSKGLYVMLIDLICDGLKFVVYIIFFCLLFVYYGLPIHIIREVWVSFQTFQKALTSFIKYIRLTSNLEQRFPDALQEEIQSAGDCLICREGMDRAKKLPCGHIFHLDCLRMWLQHQQSCPLCRADIPLIAPAPAAQNPPVAAAAAAPVQPENVAGAVGAAADSGGVTAGETSATDSDFVPGFFRVVDGLDVVVRDSCDGKAGVVRVIPAGTLIFALARKQETETALGFGVNGGAGECTRSWLQLTDGWVLESTAYTGFSKVYIALMEIEDIVASLEKQNREQNERKSAESGSDPGLTRAGTSEGQAQSSSPLQQLVQRRLIKNSTKSKTHSVVGDSSRLGILHYHGRSPCALDHSREEGKEVSTSDASGREEDDDVDLDLLTLLDVQEQVEDMASSVAVIQEQLTITQARINRVISDYQKRRSRQAALAAKARKILSKIEFLDMLEPPSTSIEKEKNVTPTKEESSKLKNAADVLASPEKVPAKETSITTSVSSEMTLSPDNPNFQKQTDGGVCGQSLAEEKDASQPLRLLRQRYLASLDSKANTDKNE